jgi:hypothetical protein
MPIHVSIADLETAIEWLRINGGKESEASCHKVAKWIEQEVKNRTIRSAAREHKVPISFARAAIKHTSK